MEPSSVTENGFVLPPYRHTFLVNYTRQSKLIAFGLVLAGGIALTYLLVHSLTQITSRVSEDVKKSERHTAKIFSADSNKEKKTAGSKSQEATGSAIVASGNGGPEIINRQDDRTVPMAQAPDPDLTENTAQGDLPRISEDGRQPWQVYARPFNTADKRPRLAILVADLGMSRTLTDAAVTRLPPAVTLAFDAQSPTIGAWAGRARQEGHEILITVPMEPFDYPRSDPGPHTLLTTLGNTANLEKLNWSLRQASGYIGITTLTGSRFTTDSDKLKQVMSALRERGLMVLDAHAAPHGVVTELAHQEHVPVATVNVRIEEDLSPQAIDAALLQLQQAAQLNGHAIGIVPPLPIVIDRLQAWLKTLPEQGIALAPISAVVQ